MMKTIIAPQKTCQYGAFATKVAADVRQRLGNGTITLNGRIIWGYGTPVILIDFFNKCSKLKTLKIIMAQYEPVSIETRKSDLLQQIARVLNIEEENYIN